MPGQWKCLTKMEYLNNNSKNLQLVQNSAACILTKTQKFDHITPILMNLHWLPVRCRIQHQTLPLA